MGGIQLLLNTTKDALLTQQYALNVLGHNIANVNTPGYSRQSPVLQAQRPMPFGGHLFGRGVELGEIARNTNIFIETRLREWQTDLATLSEKQVYMDALEGIFNENSEYSLTNQLVKFWNVWDDLSNNPSGMPERNVV